MIHRQFIRFVAIGLASNLTLYAAYLALTRWGMDSRPAMTLTYVSGVLAGFALNRSITFRFEGGRFVALLRYIAVYVIGYGIDLACLWLLADRAGIPHQIVQGGVTLVLPLVLFALQKLWVFRAPAASPLKAEYAP